MRSRSSAKMVVASSSWPSYILSMWLLWSLSFQWGMLMVFGLRLENVSVPQSGILGGSVTLSCDYSLQPSEKLFSLKWYRNGHEFFRFNPGTRDSTSVNTFPLPDVHVDKGETMQVQNNHVAFRLKNLNLDSGGTYKCEVSADFPSFQTLHGEGNLSIMAIPPSPKPRLFGFPSSVTFGDRINGNCSFANTYPAAELTLYLNNSKIINSKELDTEVIHYEPVQFGSRLTSITGVKIRAGPKHFQHGTLEIRCNARLFDQMWEARWNITHQNYQAPFHTAGQNRYSSGIDGCIPVRAECMMMIVVSTAAAFVVIFNFLSVLNL